MDFVSFDLAKKLKEKGYPQKTLGCFDMLGACYISDGRFYDEGCVVDVNKAFSAPTIHQVLKWLREKHATHIEITLGRDGWYFEIIQYEYYEEEKQYDCKLISISFIKDSYEESALAGIQYVLDNLI